MLPRGSSSNIGNAMLPLATGRACLRVFARGRRGQRIFQRIFQRFAVNFVVRSGQIGPSGQYSV